MDHQRQPGPAVAGKEALEATVMIGVAVRDNDRAQVLDRDAEQVEVSAETIGRQPPVVEDRASLPVGLDGDEGRESMLGDELLTL